MNTFMDYYAQLGVDADASPSTIKAAFKKLALQYHPDVYKGADAHERMRSILLAYQTLNNPAARKLYDIQRSEHNQDRRKDYSANQHMPQAYASRHVGVEISPSARRDRHRHYDFPDFPVGQPVVVDLVDIAYNLEAYEASTLLSQGILRGNAPETEHHAYYCHRCHYHWHAPSANGRVRRQELPIYCPHCHAIDWTEYLLMRCIHCSAVFESEQIRYEIGSHVYGKSDQAEAVLCPPYELFPLCPYCGQARWSPAENERVSDIRLRAQQRATLLRVLLICAIIVAAVILGLVILANLH